VARWMTCGYMYSMLSRVDDKGRCEEKSDYCTVRAGRSGDVHVARHVVELLSRRLLLQD